MEHQDLKKGWNQQGEFTQEYFRRTNLSIKRFGVGGILDFFSILVSVEDMTSGRIWNNIKVALMDFIGELTHAI